MAIEPIGKVVPDRENKQFGAITNTKCDRRVNFRGIWGHARQVSDQPKADTKMAGVLVASQRVEMVKVK
jgi:hypothetical protein